MMFPNATMFFGKLPNRSDFFRYNATGPEIRALDAWLQESLHAAERRFLSDWPAVYREAPAYDFVFRMDRTDTALVGVLNPSRDQSGRRFPFIVAGLIDMAGLDRRIPALVPLVFAEFFRESRTLAEGAASGSDAADIVSRADGLTSLLAPPVELRRRDYEAYLGSTTWGEFCEHLFGSFESPRKSTLVHNLADSLSPTVISREIRGSAGLRFPLGSGDAFLPEEVSFWNDLGLNISAGHAVPASMFWDASGGPIPAYHFLVCGKPHAKLYFSLVRPDRENDGVCRLDEDKIAGGVEHRKLTIRVQSALESPALTLREFLGVFKGGIS